VDLICSLSSTQEIKNFYLETVATLIKDRKQKSCFVQDVIHTDISASKVIKFVLTNVINKQEDRVSVITNFKRNLYKI